MLEADDSPLSFTGAMESRRSPAPVSEAESNKSLERTTAESAFFHSQMLGGRRSALRWGTSALHEKAAVICGGHVSRIQTRQ